MPSKKAPPQCEYKNPQTGRRCRRHSNGKDKGHYFCWQHLDPKARQPKPQPAKRHNRLYNIGRLPNLNRPPKQYKSGINGDKRRGRKPIPIDWDVVQKMLEHQCTSEEIADYLGISKPTLLARDEYLNCFKKALARGRVSLRRLQWTLAERGDRTMLIWLGKQYLGQSDQLDQRLSGPGGGPVRVQTANLSVLTTAELETLSKLLEKASVVEGADSTS